jgi:hypothetical protein
MTPSTPCPLLVDTYLRPTYPFPTEWSASGSFDGQYDDASMHMTGAQADFKKKLFEISEVVILHLIFLASGVVC